MSGNRSEVTRFRSGYTNPNISLAEIQERNKAYRQYKEAANRQGFFDATRESAYADKVREETLSKERMVPRTIQALTNEAYKVFPEIIFREYFTNLVKESLLWDDYAVKEMANGIRYMSHKYIAEAIGGLEGLKQAAIESKSPYLEKVYNVCMEAGKTIAKKKKEKMEKTINSSNVDNAKLDFSIDEDDNEMINQKMDTLNIEDISDMVKNKVLQVVKDENDSQKKDDEFITNLKEDIQDAESKDDIPEEKVNGELPRTINNGDAPAATPTTGTADTEATGGESKGKKKKEDDDSDDTNDASAGDSDSDDTKTKKPEKKEDKPKKEDSEDDTKDDTKSESSKNDDKYDDDSSKKDDDKDAGKKDDDDKKDEKDAKKTAKESIETYALNSRIDVQRSLFRSMVHRSYNRAVIEGASDIAAIHDEDSDTHVSSDHNRPSNDVNVYDIYLQSENEDLSYIDFVKNNETKSFGDNTKIDPDEVLAEAIGMYTILECAYSIKLINPSIRNLKRAIAWNIKH